jgi:hypothetical protein
MEPMQIQKIENLLASVEMEDEAKKLMRVFFESISVQPQFPKIIDLLERFPSVYENFCKCFCLKKDFLSTNNNADDWIGLVTAEDEILNKL